MTSLFNLPISTDAQFEALFAVFPSKRRGTRRLAYPAWRKAIKREDPEVILAGAKAYAESDPGEYAKGLPAWINGDCWAIEYGTTAKAKPDKSVMKSKYFDLKTRYKKPYHDFMGDAAIKEMFDLEKELAG